MSRTVNRKTITSIISVAVLFCFTGTALGDQYDDQINALKQQAVTQQQQAASAQAQATTYQQKVAQLQSQMSAMQTQINLSQLRFDQVSQSITDNEAKLAVQKKVLAANIEAMYLASTVTPLEMLASSKSFSDFFDQQEYQDKVKDGVQNAMGQVQTLQAQLEGQKKQVTELLINQEGQQQQLASTQSQVNQLLATAQQSAAAANQQVQTDNSQIATLQAQQAAAIAAASRRVEVPGASGGSGGACDNGSGNGGYPMEWCNAEKDTIIDSWGMYNRECVSYAAWKATQDGFYVPYWGGRGNADQWPSDAESAGIPVDNTPQIGNVAIYTGGPYGHAMIVQAINGSTVTVSSINADDAGHFEFDVWPISDLVFIHFQ
jgi:surface antigen